MDQNRTNYLLQRFADGSISADEQLELTLLLQKNDREDLLDYVTGLMEKEGANSIANNQYSDKSIFEKIISADKTGIPAITTDRRKFNKLWIPAAASVVLLLSAGTWFMLTRNNKKEQPASVASTRKAMPEKDPGRNTAILTLGDNSFVELDSAGNGVISTQGGSLVKLADGQIAYQPQHADPNHIIYNKITTPRGGEFSVTLSDGTKVWLNAASSIRFPTVFTGAKREVELTGEAYLEVAEDNKHPFEVKINNVNVAVLGTQFNINGYDDEGEIVTTLVSGRVRVSATGSNDQLLQPGEHAVLNDNGKLFVEKADITEETAWKNGKTNFNGANIKQIMRQISRWYNVDVVYKGNAVNMDFTCTVSRKDKLSKLLGLLELTGAVEFTMEGNTIIVH